MRAILDPAAEKGVRVILCHRHAYWPYLTEHGEAAYRREFVQAGADLGGHPAVFGFHVGDEPNTASFPFACQAMRLQKERPDRRSRLAARNPSRQNRTNTYRSR